MHTANSDNTTSTDNLPHSQRRAIAWRQKKGQEFVDEYLAYRFSLYGLGVFSSGSKMLQAFLQEEATHPPRETSETPHLQEAAKLSVIAPLAHEFVAADPVSAFLATELPIELITPPATECCSADTCEDCVTDCLTSSQVDNIELTPYQASMATVPIISTIEIVSQTTVFRQTLSVKPFSSYDDYLFKTLRLHCSSAKCKEMIGKAYASRKNYRPGVLVDLAKISNDCAAMVVRYLDCRTRFFLRADSAEIRAYAENLNLARSACSRTRFKSHAEMQIRRSNHPMPEFNDNHLLPFDCICQSTVFERPEVIHCTSFKDAMLRLSYSPPIPSACGAYHDVKLSLD